MVPNSIQSPWSLVFPSFVLLCATMIYALYLFDRHCACIYQQKWNTNQTSTLSPEEEAKLVFGVVISLRNLAMKLSLNEYFFILMT
jgi:hypothetical protein